MLVFPMSAVSSIKFPHLYSVLAWPESLRFPAKLWLFQGFFLGMVTVMVVPLPGWLSSCTVP